MRTKIAVELPASNSTLLPSGPLRVYCEIDSFWGVQVAIPDPIGFASTGDPAGPVGQVRLTPAQRHEVAKLAESRLVIQ